LGDSVTFVTTKGTNYIGITAYKSERKILVISMSHHKASDIRECQVMQIDTPNHIRKYVAHYHQRGWVVNPVPSLTCVGKGNNTAFAYHSPLRLIQVCQAEQILYRIVLWYVPLWEAYRHAVFTVGRKKFEIEGQDDT
jgi:hypothetical protein